MKNYFISGVDTDIGKTFVSLGLCLAHIERGEKVGYFKPFQSGAYSENGTLKAPDIEELKKYTDIKSMYSYLFEGEVSPHLASILNNTKVDINKIKKDLKNFSKQFDLTIIEGAGGFYCPAYKGKLFSDVIKALKQELIIVTTPDLGRLNHTLMTLKLIKHHKIKLKGLIINKMPKNKTTSQENFIKELKLFSDVTILGIIPEIKKPSKKNIINAFRNINL